jgi:hypothetical protein
MSVSINGSGAITYNDGSTQANSQVGMKNRIIDGGFIINQRAYVSNTALSAGVYAHDRWKAGSGGCTYTFTQGSLGVNTTITITAGTLVQVIEGCNLAEGGTYVLSWTGTAQGRLNGGTYGSSGTVTVTGWTAGTNLNVEFNTGTVGSVQLEKGSTATSFDYRPYTTELQLCQRYAFNFNSTNASNTYLRYAVGQSNTTVQAEPNIRLPVTMRITPSLTAPAASQFTLYSGGGLYTLTALAIDGFSPNGGNLVVTVASGLTTGGACSLLSNNNNTSYLLFTAEL